MQEIRNVTFSFQTCQPDQRHRQLLEVIGKLVSCWTSLFTLKAIAIVMI